MANYFTGTFSQGSTGNKSVTGLGFQPKFLRFVVAQKFNVTEDNVAHLSMGRTDGTRQSANAILADATGNHTRNHSNYCVVHYIRNGSGTFTKNLSASFVSFDADGFTLNFDAADANFQIIVEASS